MKKQTYDIYFSFLLMAIHLFKDDIKNAVAFLNTQREVVLHIKNTSYTEGSEALAIVSPELISRTIGSIRFSTRKLEYFQIRCHK